LDLLVVLLCNEGLWGCGYWFYLLSESLRPLERGANYEKRPYFELCPGSTPLMYYCDYVTTTNKPNKQANMVSIIRCILCKDYISRE
jgi:hypothetical protein